MQDHRSGEEESDDAPQWPSPPRRRGEPPPHHDPARRRREDGRKQTIVHAHQTRRRRSHSQLDAVPDTRFARELHERDPDPQDAPHRNQLNHVPLPLQNREQDHRDPSRASQQTPHVLQSEQSLRQHPVEQEREPVISVVGQHPRPGEPDHRGHQQRGRLWLGEGERVGNRGKDRRVPVPLKGVQRPISVPPDRPQIEHRHDG